MPYVEQIKSLERSVKGLTKSNGVFRANAGSSELKLTEEIIFLRTENENLNRENKNLLERLRGAGL